MSFGHVGSADSNMIFVLQWTAPVTTDKSNKRRSRISNASMLTLREIISEGRFESDSRALQGSPTSSLVTRSWRIRLLFMMEITNGFARFATGGLPLEHGVNVSPRLPVVYIRESDNGWSSQSLVFSWER